MNGPARDTARAISGRIGQDSHSRPPTRARHRIATRRDPAPWLAILVTVALITGAALTIVLGAAPPIQPPPVVRTPVVAPLVPVAPPPAVTVVVGKNARAGSGCSDLVIPGIDDNGTATVCRPTPEGLRWARR